MTRDFAREPADKKPYEAPTLQKQQRLVEVLGQTVPSLTTPGATGPIITPTPTGSSPA